MLEIPARINAANSATALDTNACFAGADNSGQMRRIGIGMELVCNPPIMLLDEPTSALDAVNTRLVVAALKGLAKQGVLVVASLHQPRHAVYEMLDRLLLLRKGELMYGGAPIAQG